MFDCTLESLSEVVRHMAKRIDVLEANQRNAESGTTGCSAGRMPELSEENRPVQPAGNPALVELLMFVTERIAGVVGEVGSIESGYNKGALDSYLIVAEKTRLLLERGAA